MDRPRHSLPLFKEKINLPTLPVAMGIVIAMATPSLCRAHNLTLFAIFVLPARPQKLVGKFLDCKKHLAGSWAGILGDFFRPTKQRPNNFRDSGHFS